MNGPQDLRCGGKRHAILLEGGSVLEIKCDSRLCGAGPGIVVLHQWDLREQPPTMKTKRYREIRAAKGNGVR